MLLPKPPVNVALLTAVSNLRKSLGGKGASNAGALFGGAKFNSAQNARQRYSVGNFSGTGVSLGSQMAARAQNKFGDKAKDLLKDRMKEAGRNLSSFAPFILGPEIAQNLFPEPEEMTSAEQSGAGKGKILGSLAGGVIGGSIGAFFGGPIGAFIGGTLGSIAGEFLGGMIGGGVGSLYDRMNGGSPIDFANANFNRKELEDIKKNGIDAGVLRKYKESGKYKVGTGSDTSYVKNAILGKETNSMEQIDQKLQQMSKAYNDAFYNSEFALTYMLRA